MSKVSESPGRTRLFLERCFAASVLFFISPILLIAIVLVRLTSRSPAIYRQVRTGLAGRTFVIYKLRSMYQNCEVGTGAKWSNGKQDPRITPIGRILRLTHFDELPQLWNIVLGDMSFVGPRPERPEILSELSLHIAGIDDRVKVRPGLTGLAQIQQPSDQSHDCFRKKLEYDRVYINHRSFFLDLRIILGTVLYLLGCSYSTLRTLMSLPTPQPEIESVPRLIQNHEQPVEIVTAVEVG
jgi:lipopolysaccharide/colanic/teichoic acid biosynthesis glycosyltransferase